MASSSRCLILSFAILSFVSLLIPGVAATTALFKNCAIETIYQFGDSISDTGNLIREEPIGPLTPFSHLPYGETFFRRPTGRCSNGLLMIDFIALAHELPLLNPYLEKGADFTHGVNFAVAGATALSASSLANNKIISPVTNTSLSVQIKWFKTHLKSICHTKTECQHKLKKALFMVGEVGGNDYNYAFIQGKTMAEVQRLVPVVVKTIKDTVKKVIDLGAVRVVVPGNFPIGCFPIYLTTFQSNNPASFDKSRCLKDLNKFAMFHNTHLQQAIDQLRKEYPDIEILYADYYSAFKWVLQGAPLLGFRPSTVFKACCGTGGAYNFDGNRMCGAAGVPVCLDPELHLSWDGVHLTQKAYSFMAQWLIRNLKLVNQCKLVE